MLPARNRPLADDVAERLRAAIQQGHFGPGEHLTAERLATMLEVSRGPVREALVQLEREGLVLNRRHRGAVVARLSRKDADEVYSLRFPMEQFAIQAAIRRGRPEDFTAMEEVVDAFASATNQRAAGQSWAELDLHFHDLIYRAARHLRLYDCWSLLRPQVHVIVLSAYASWPDFFRERTVQRHREILTALRDRDEDAALHRSGEHLRDAYLQVIRSYPSDDSDPQGLPNLPQVPR